MNICDAIARMEGWGVPSSRARRNHNPGNICYGSFAQRHGATGTDGRFAIFPSDDAGFSALAELLEAGYVGMTLREAINKYAPPKENDTLNYVDLVAEWTGIGPETVLQSECIAEKTGA